MKHIHIDFISDVACPWCAVGLGSLEQAMLELKDELSVDIQFHPFELNPQMAKGGEDTTEHLMKKYRLSPQEVSKNQKQISERAASVGFAFNENTRPRIFNTFTCHRLLHWAFVEHGAQSQYKLKRELLSCYFTRNENVDDVNILLAAVDHVGLPIDQARKAIETDAYATEVKESISHAQNMGIQAVPSVIIGEKLLVQGGQPPDIFVKALRQIAHSMAVS